MDFFRVKHIKSWGEFSSFASKMTDYQAKIYRGHSDHDWELETTLNRALKRNKKSKKYYVNNEHWMLHEFKRRAHLYKKDLTDKDDKISWLALMQHHGAPTRLLDFTHSIFVAAYFALINAENDAAIWSINEIWLRNSSLRLSGKEIDLFDGELRDDHLKQINEFGNNYLSSIHKTHKAIQKNGKSIKSGTLFVEPEKQTKRLAIQQGVFVMPLDIRKSFLKNLKEQYNLTRSGSSLQLKDQVTKIWISQKARFEILAKLKEMNVTAETLFPGLDGFAKSLEHIKLAT